MESRDVQIPGLRMHCLVAGEGGPRTPVVLVHGFPQTSHSWRHQIPVLAAAGHPVYALDTRGFGRTDKPRIRVNRAMLADDVVRCCDALDLAEPVLVGHDWGGIIAFKAAIDRPERFARLGLLDSPITTMGPSGPHTYWAKAAPWPERFYAQHARQFIEVLLGGRDPAGLPGPPANGFLMSSRRREVPWLDDGSLEHYVQAFSDPGAHFAAIQYYRYGMPFHRVIADPDAPDGERFEPLTEAEVAEMWNHPGGLAAHPRHDEYFDFAPEDRRKTYDRPTLFVYSRNKLDRLPVHGDGIVPSGNPYAEQWGRHFPDLTVRGAPCGHWIPEEAPEFLAELILDLAGS